MLTAATTAIFRRHDAHLTDVIVAEVYISSQHDISLPRSGAKTAPSQFIYSWSHQPHITLIPKDFINRQLKIAFVPAGVSSCSLYTSGKMH